MRSARPLAALLAVALLLPLLPTALAHENQAVAEGRHRVPAYSAVEFPAMIHYHRLAGTVTVVGDTGAVLVRVVGPEERALVAGPGRELRVNALVPCCDDDGWADHVVRVENNGARALDVDVRLSFLHDGLAVAASDAETGAALSMLLFAGVPALLGARALRRGRVGEPARRWLLVSGGAQLAMWLLAAALAVPAMLAYGGSPAAGTMAAAAHLPWVGTAIVGVMDLLVLALLALWILALSAWVAAARREPTRRPVAALGLLLGASALGAAVAWGAEYRLWLVPLVAGALAAALPLGWLALRDAGREGEADAPEAGPAA